MRVFILAVLAMALGSAALAEAVHVPPGDSRAMPVVIVLHGGGGSGAQVRRGSGFDASADAAGVIAYYPDAVGRVWNDGRNPQRGGDDVARLLAEVDALAARGLGDGGPVYVIGHSNGGGMAMRLACARPDRVAGIAVVATKVLLAAPCENPNAPVPALFLHGTNDEIAPHAGRRLEDADPAIARLAQRLGGAMSAAETAAHWAMRNGCAPVAQTRDLDPAPGDDVVLRVHDYAGCTAPMRWVEMIGAGHGWPGGRSLLTRLRGETAVSDLNAGAAALSFWGL